MSLEVKYGFLVEAQEIFEEMLQVKMERLRRLELRKAIKHLVNAMEPFVEERNALVQEYGENGEITPESARWDEFRVEYEDLLNQVTELEVLELSPALLDTVPMSTRQENILVVCGFAPEAVEA